MRKQQESNIVDEFGRPFQKALNYRDVFNRDLSIADKWGRFGKPKKASLIAEYRGLTKACVDSNANFVSSISLRTFRQSRRKNTRWFTRPVPKHMVHHLVTKGYPVQNNQNVEEILDHPLKKHLTPALIKNLQRYLEIVGESYLFTTVSPIGVQNIKTLLAHQVIPELNSIRTEVVGYRYGDDTLKPNTAQYKIIPFIYEDPADPFSGLSWVAGVFREITVLNKYLATEEALLDNEGRPDAAFSPEEGIGEDEAARLERRFQNKFRKGGIGGVLVLEEKGSFEPLNYSPRDLSRLDVYKHTSEIICNGADIPPALLAAEFATQYDVDATLQQRRIQFGIVPRLKVLEQIINEQIIPLYDDSGELFVAFDDPVLQNKQLEMQEVEKGIRLPNEARVSRGLEPKDWGELPAGMFSPDVGTVDDTPDTEIETEQPLNDTKVRLANEIVKQVAEGTLPRDAGIGQLVILLGMTPDEAETIMGSAGEEVEEEQLPPAPQEEVAIESKILDTDGTPIKHIKQQGHNKQLPSGDELKEVVIEFFEKQQKEIVASINVSKAKGMKAMPERFIPKDKWINELKEKALPLLLIDALKAYEGKQDELIRVGATPDKFDTTKLKAVIEKSAYDFAESTNATTTLDLNAALQKLREEFSEGLVEGDRMSELVKRVNSVFERATKERAFLIAQSESSRAVHDATRQAAKDSGVVKGFKLLLSSNACDLCQRVAAKGAIGLDDHFHYDEKAPAAYQKRFVPVHPSCRCAVEELI